MKIVNYRNRLFSVQEFMKLTRSRGSGGLFRRTLKPVLMKYRADLYELSKNRNGEFNMKKVVNGRRNAYRPKRVSRYNNNNFPY